MKFYYFHLMPYYMEHDAPSSWVTLSNRHYDPSLGHTLYNQYLDQLEQARNAAGEKDVTLAGGASIAQQYLKAGLVDELQIHVAPVFLGDGVRLFESLGNDRPELEATRVVDSPTVTHLRYRVQKGART